MVIFIVEVQQPKRKTKEIFKVRFSRMRPKTGYCIVFNNLNFYFSRYLQPVYFSSTLMTSYIALKFFAKKALPESYLCPEPYNTLTFLLCTGANLGIQLWVTFVSGTTMMRILPRHQNGLVQRHLFPKYMFLTSLFTFGSLSSFLNMKPSSSWTNDALTMVKLFEI